MPEAAGVAGSETRSVRALSGDAAPAPAPRFLLATAFGGVQLHALPERGEVIIGRGAESDIVLDFDAISRRHASLRIPSHLGEHCTLADLSSRNGTVLRGALLRGGDRRPLAYGDSFSIGPVSLLLVPPRTAAAAGEQLTASRVQLHDVDADPPGPLLSSVARARLSVVVFGETGVGKELLARTIHRLSARSGAFVAINCAALSESLLESELFGHERGAFTGAVTAKPGLLVAATGGTLLLDEIGEMAPASQAKLLRAIETQTVLPVGSVQPVAIDVRFLAATHRNLLAEVERGRFRRDLYYRLAGFAFEVPPLRDRRAQLPKLALRLVAAAAARSALPVPLVAPRAMAALAAHDWPGNVRELRNVLERAVLLAAGGSIDACHLMFDTARDPLAGDVPGDVQADDERAEILRALEACAGNQTRAARMLAISRTTLVHKLRLYGVPRPRR